MDLLGELYYVVSAIEPLEGLQIVSAKLRVSSDVGCFRAGAQ